MNQNNKCCTTEKTKAGRGLFSGILYGLLPHSFCLTFALFSILGAITATAFLKNILLIPNIFIYLVVISLILATVSVYIYLNKTGCLCKSGIKSNWKYISTIYSATIIINIIFFYGVIPILANINSNYIKGDQSGLAETTIKVQIPCTGHSFLIIQEINKVEGVSGVKFVSPDVFVVRYDTKNTSPEKIVSQDIFKEYEAIIE